MFIYTMSMPLWGVFVFRQNKILKLPVILATAKKDLRNMVTVLWQLKESLQHTTSSIYEFINTNDTDSSSDNSEGHASPNKKLKRSRNRSSPEFSRRFSRNN
ncbi:hypothetical protein BDC45DRAFT_509016 [Circinella umbellata]|nr:hypothetical protein BDC45DRAFT_509016 [Circinella umbellata]